MKKTLTTLTLLIIVAAIHTQPLTTTATYTVSDSTKVMQLISTARRTPDNGKQFLNIAKQFIGTPYVAHTLDQSPTERLVVNISQVDCTTYVEYALAIHLCLKNKKYTFRDFCHYLAHIRYANGKVSYATRNHYFTHWINNNAHNRYISEKKTKQYPFTATQTINVNYMTTHSQQYQMLRNNPQRKTQIRKLQQSINRQQYPYIPKANIRNTAQLRSIISDGDIIAIVTQKKGLDIAHLGIALWRKDGLHLLNASSIHKKVIIEPMTLRQYLHKHKTHLGIRVIKVL